MLPGLLEPARRIGEFGEPGSPGRRQLGGRGEGRPSGEETVDVAAPQTQ